MAQIINLKSGLNDIYVYIFFFFWGEVVFSANYIRPNNHDIFFYIVDCHNIIE